MMATTLLIAVPDLLFRAKLRGAAQDAGAETTAAANPEAVLERSLALRPDAVVVDLGDERLGPFDLIRRLKSEPALVSTLVIGFFPHVRTDLRDAAKEAGCDVILPRSVVARALAGILCGERFDGEGEL